MEEGCTFFVHQGLQEVIINKNATCWEGEEIFRIDEYALRDLVNDRVLCLDCRGKHTSPVVAPTSIPAPIAVTEAVGPKPLPLPLKTLKDFDGDITKYITWRDTELAKLNAPKVVDEIEVIESTEVTRTVEAADHKDGCAYWLGLKCTCRLR